MHQKSLYARYIKRMLDIFLSATALVFLSPVLLLFSLAGAVMMGGNPFFIQPRPGKNERVFNLIKFRTMNNKKDENGQLLPDILRLTAYGRFLRNTSIDELPELFNILKGDMSIVGPRPLLVKYLPLYNQEQRHRHDVRPGLTGYAQVHGRNGITWEERFRMDVAYSENISFKTDAKIVFKTIKLVLKRDGIDSGENNQYTIKEFTGIPEDKTC